MKKLLFVCALILATVPSMAAMTTMTQVWKVDLGTYPWFSTTNSLVRSARYNPGTDHVTVLSRDPVSTQPVMAILNAATGAEISTVSLAAATGGYVRPDGSEAFPVMKHAHTSDGITYIANLTLEWDLVPFTIYRMATETGAMTVAYTGERDDLSSITATNPGVTANNPRIGDSLDVTGTGLQTEIWAGLRRAVGPHLIRFTTTDGLNFQVSRELTIPGTTWTGSLLPVYRGLSVTGTGDSAVIWIKTDNQAAHRINAVTGVIEESIEPATSYPELTMQAHVDYFESYGSKFLAFAPSTTGTLPMHRAGYIARLGSPSATVAVSEQLTAAVPQANGNGTGAVDYDPTRSNIIYLFSNNSVSSHHIDLQGLAAAKDWQLLE